MLDTLLVQDQHIAIISGLTLVLDRTLSVLWSDFLPRKRIPSTFFLTESHDLC